MAEEHSHRDLRYNKMYTEFIIVSVSGKVGLRDFSDIPKRT